MTCRCCSAVKPNATVVSPSGLPARMFHVRARVRRLQSGDSGIELDVLINVRPEDDLTAIQDTLNSATRRNSSFAQTFMQGVLEEFQARGIEVPPALQTATVVTSGVTQLANVEMARSQWVKRPWTWCSNDCGDGVRTREVECSTGNPWACSQESGEPATQEACEDFDACGYDWMCPLGHGSDTPCEEQTSYLVFSALIPTAIFVLCTLRVIQVKLRRPTEGAAKLKNAKVVGDVPWHSSKELLSSRTSIVWDLSHPELHDKVQDVLKVENEAAPLVLHRSQIFEEDGTETAPTIQRQSPWELQYKMYELNQRVEYYSTTNEMWLAGRISNTRVTAVPKPTIMYDVKLGKSEQVRECVPLEYLRDLFVDGEPCSVFSAGLDRWLPAVVYGPQSTVCTSVGYEIMLVGASGYKDEKFNASASCLRRRFPPGSVVEAYEDGVQGWVQATVLQEQVQEDMEVLSAAWEAITAKEFGLVQNPGDPENPLLDSGGETMEAASRRSFASGLASVRAPDKTDVERAQMITARGKANSHGAPRRADDAELCRWSLVEVPVGESKSVLKHCFASQSGADSVSLGCEGLNQADCCPF
eukprot:TRINITY_DN1999_c0_g1_i2.p1 TRINITY_DN1999_c0_g1~~TRINITY_DN1999_c0_g1_i2.p1  ORF type:complete len:587 (+),score=62.67 TRINITY_DN1999_c0_g1_i2:705-2465(+)